jgi:hypothetical protein
VKAFFVTAYFGGKTYESNGIAFIPEPGKEGKITILASWCGRDFVAEQWPGSYADDLRGETVEVPDEVLDITKQLLATASGLSSGTANIKLRRLLGARLVSRLHTDPMLSA